MEKNSIQTKILLAVQILVGIGLIVFGLNKFLHFMPNPEVSQEMGMFMQALGKTGYMFTLVGAIQFIAGLSFVLNRFVPLMAIVIVPVMLNAMLAHLFLDPAGIGGSLVILLLILVVMFKNKESYVTVLKA
ncbi:DoxX family membrane protein [Arcobacter sp. YIC-464]|uniref:DoxX family membrane protein n=1 Tax=Arcobacter sp. YIC-464 TaxID=3376631 RepID=UPI003C223BC5